MDRVTQVLLERLLTADGAVGDVFARSLTSLRTYLDMDVAFVGEFLDGQRYFRHVDSRPGVASLELGACDPVENSLCARVVQGRVGGLLQDAAADAVATEVEAVKSKGVRAHLSVPIRLSDGRVYGTLCCFSLKPNYTLNERDLNMMRAFAEVVAGQIEKDVEVQAARDADLVRVEQVFKAGAISIVYQPIYNIVQNRLDGFEALARFNVEPRRSPDVWFADAATVGKGTELESLAIRIALEALNVLPEWCYVSVNASPKTILEGNFDSLLGPYSLDRVVVEVTEHEAVEHYGELAAALAPLRKRGLRLAIDDAGAGYASFRHILNLAPHIIKLDVSITRDVHIDPTRHALATAISGFATATGSRLVAEGVETADEWRALRRLGFNKAQGYFLGRPMARHEALSLTQEGKTLDSQFGDDLKSLRS